jgi:hypothetical protein
MWGGVVVPLRVREVLGDSVDKNMFGSIPRVEGTCRYESRCLVIHVRVSINGRDPLGAIIVMRKDCPRSSRNAYGRFKTSGGASKSPMSHKGSLMP